jgi:bifunctional lysine-specific demethylase and histidyl-hydroxylase NO66
VTRTRTIRTPTPTTLTPTRATPTRTPQTRASSTARRGLARCIEPLPAEEFFAEHWERRPLVVARNERGRFDDLLSLADVERLICSSGIRYPSIRLVRAGATIALRDYTSDLPWRPDPLTGTADIRRVLAEFEAGATVVLQALHHTWEPLARFCRSLEQLLDHAVQANAYFTPRDSQGLAVHHDTHDVFVLQVHGEKRWLVYEPAWPLPLKNQRYRKELGAPGEPVHDVVLRPGDTLYMPRGWLHMATTSATDSLHLTVGVNVYSWLDAIKAALEECGDDVDFRREARSDSDLQDELVARLLERLGPDDVARRKRKRFVKSRRPVLTGQLSQLRALDRLDEDTLLERRDTVVADMAVAEEEVKLFYDGHQLAFPADVEREIEFMLGADEPFRPSDLPGELDAESRLVLVRRLVREGFLELSEGGRAGPSRRSGGHAAE